MRFFLLLCFLPSLLFSTINMTINPETKDSLYVPIPTSFKQIWKSEDGKMVEYIPENETLENWSEIITVEIIPNQIGMLEIFLRKHKIAIETLFLKTELHRSEYSMQEEKGILVGYSHYRNPHYIVVKQTVDNNFIESMGMKLVQGKKSLYRVAYNIKYPNKSPHAPLEEKIQTFLESCIINPKLD